MSQDRNFSLKPSRRNDVSLTFSTGLTGQYWNWANAQFQYWQGLNYPFVSENKR